MNLRHGFDLRMIPLAACAFALSGSLALGQYAGPAVTSPAPQASAPASAMEAAYANIDILPGDIISIETYGLPELTTISMVASGSITSGASPALSGVKVGADGEIVLPYIGSIKVAGLTPAQTAALIARKLKADGILVDPQVSVQLADSPTRVISVIGEVQRPEPVPAFGHLRLLDAISACGGFTLLASHTVTVRRGEQSIVVHLGTNPDDAGISNIPLLPGDTVIVPRVGDVYVVGQVKTQSAIPLSSNYPVTVLRAIAMAGGVQYGAALSKARIIRSTAGNQHVEIMLDLKKIMYGRQQDVALKSDDVLFVPSNAFKAALAGGAASVVATLLYGVAYTSSVVK
ncbi:MAG TPA: polysaccharide biosynthesis/export family protein [Terracidiphilus sp.]|nr:polysaccharide biosynthesis/export family protein [Terracidiphilus sp.]